MAKPSGVWGIDIGRCALKALRCRLDGDAVVADGFDYIEYPKLLTQPDADAPQLVKEAIEQFLSRNSLRGDKVAISVPGESGLARFFKPPPVDVKKIADIVKYEARQQIPFALEDVIWDYQRMPGGQEVDGFALDTEIGLFAMKREQVSKALQPFLNAAIEVDVIQLAPIACYNYISYDVTKNLPDDVPYEADNPPKSIVVLSIGTDTTDLVVTNGYRVWQRNIPLGGNHFTKQLSKDLKLTFAKAEHLKRNPKQAEDPKAVFQAMRPVFGDMVTEIQRSLNFFGSLDRKAKIGSVVLLGNTVKLPGLTQYLSKHLGYDVKEIESFARMTGAPVVTSPSFKDNMLAFGGCYGLCLQGLGKSKLSTNLLPREIVTQRVIKAKKPWAVGAVATVMLACAFNYIFTYRVWNESHPENVVANVKWDDAIKNASSVSSTSSKLIADDKAKVENLELLKQIGQEVVGAGDRRVLWLELIKALNEAMPKMADTLQPGEIPDVKKLPFDRRKDLKIVYVETQYFPELNYWFTDEVKKKYLELNPELLVASTDPNAMPGAPGAPGMPAAPGMPGAPGMPATGLPATGMPSPAMPGMPMPGMQTGMPGAIDPMTGMPMAGGGSTIDMSMVQVPGPSGPGWVVELYGFHYYNDPADRRNAGPAHVKNTLLKQLKEGFIEVPVGAGGALERFSMKELGIGYAILAIDPKPRDSQIPNPNYVPPANSLTDGFGGMPGPMPIPGAKAPGAKAGAAAAEIDPKDNPPFFKVSRYDFVVQFCWQEKPMNVRLEERQKAFIAAQEKAAADAAAAAAMPPGTAPNPGTPNPAIPVAPGNPVQPAPAVPVPGLPAPGLPAPGVPAPVPAIPDDPGAAPVATPAAGDPAAGVPAPGVPVPGAPAPGAPAPGPAAPAAPPAEAPAAPALPDDFDPAAAEGAPPAAAPAAPPAAAPIPPVPEIP